MKPCLVLNRKLKATVPLTASTLLAVAAPAPTLIADSSAADGDGATQTNAVPALEGGCPACSNPVANYFLDWFTRVSQTQAEQPHWVTPLVTVTPRLEEELRYDQLYESDHDDHSLTSYGGGKGLELIPAEHIELIIGVPSYQTQFSSPQHKDGWTDESFLIKYRLLAANEQEGNYILTAFMGLSVPNGSDNTTARHYLYTPTLAFGKGWGDFDVQSTLAVTIPDDGAVKSGAGTPILSNTALQYRVMKYFWPEMEANFTYWPNGEHDELSQLYITPGLLIGRIPIAGSLGLTFGVGYQMAVTDEHPNYRNNLFFSVRLPF